MREIKLTDEQESIVDAVFSNEEVILVNALAGTGKTTTCFEVMKRAAKKNLRVLYVVFNKEMASEALEKAKKLGLDVEIKTVHGFAFQQLAKRGYFKNKAVGSFKTKDISEILELKHFEAFCVLEFFNHFLFSNYDFDKIEDFVSYKIEKSPFFRRKAEIVGEKLPTLLKTLINLLKNGNRLPLPHDFYLKDYVFSNFPALKKYDIVILDESQDANPLFLEFLKKFAAKKLIIGDKHQRIYHFRNTVNAFKFFENAKTLYLTQTFRFSHNIAELANIILKFKGEKKEIKPALIPRKVNKEYAIISYTNSALLEFYLKSEEKHSLAFERNIKEVIKTLASVLALKEGYTQELPVDHTIFNAFRSFSELEDYVKEIEQAYYKKNGEEEGENVITDIELLKAYYLSEHFSQSDLVTLIHEYEKNKDKEKLYYLTTAHSAKGLEYNMTFLLKDLAIPKEALQTYQNSVKNKQQVNPQLLTSINTLYVALTRASLQSNINHEVCKTLDFMKNNSEDEK